MFSLLTVTSTQTEDGGLGGGTSTHGTTRLTLLPVNQTGTSDSLQAQDRPQPPQLSPVFQTPHRPYRAVPLRHIRFQLVRIMDTRPAGLYVIVLA